MRKFVLADNSLAPAGGHHFEFTEAILTVAEKAGFQPVIGANVELPDSSELPWPWPTYRVFPSTIYHEYNLFYLARWEEREAKRKAVAWPGPLRKLSNLYNKVRGRLRRKRWATHRARKGADFLDGCRALFEIVRLEPGDVVMLPTVSDVELESLGEYFEENPRTLMAQWHLYFHNNFLVGRPPEYDTQDFRLATMRKSLQSCLAAGQDYKLCFYTTTDKLADQFDRLELGHEFRQLTFPVREVLRRAVPRRSMGPKHVVCAGGFRDERGQGTLPQLVRAVWQDLLKPGRIQILVQRDKPEWKVVLPENPAACAPPSEPIVYHPHPLSTEAYNNLMRGADVGLLLHEPRSYYARLSAVFQEYVCAGIPVIVPAGCWLGDQIAEENFQHVERMLLERQAQAVTHEPVQWSAAGGSLLGSLVRGRFSFRGEQAPLEAEVAIPDGATQVIIQLRWLAPTESGQFLRLRLEQYDASGHWFPASEIALGPRDGGQSLAAMFPVPSRTAWLRLVFENAFAATAITVSEPQLTFLAAPEAGDTGLPTANSGLSFSDRSEIPRLLREIIAHYSHYRQRAQEKSNQWCHRMAPEATWAELHLDSAEAVPAHQPSRAA